MLKKLSKLINDSDWWFWERIGGRATLNNFKELDGQKIDLYINSFKDIYDNYWWSSFYKKQEKRIESDPLGVFGLQSPIKRILRLGECIYILNSKGKISDTLIERLRSRKSFRAATTEIEIASCFSQAGFDIELYPSISTGSRPDGKVIVEGAEIYYEITEQHWSSHEIEVVKKESRIINWLSQKCEHIEGSIQFNPYDEKARKVGELLALFKLHFKQRLLNPLPFQFDNSDFKVNLRRTESKGGWITIGGLEPTSNEIVRQWIKQLLRKAKQLPPKKSGVIVGSPLFLWGLEEVKSSITEVQEELRRGSHSRVSGIILCAKHVEHSGFIKHLPSVIINSNAIIDNAERIGKMANALFVFPEWF